jgi:pimeloyl-ACP methyl ester carboxylesterase
LPAYKDKWNLSPSRVLSIQGKKDRIVPFENSLFLERVLDKGKFNLIPLPEGNHSLIWTNFDVIKHELINTIEE